VRCAGLLAAVWAVPWPINTGFDEGSRYNTLLQISVGQEEIDEVRTLAMALTCMRLCVCTRAVLEVTTSAELAEIRREPCGRHGRVVGGMDAPAARVCFMACSPRKVGSKPLHDGRWCGNAWGSC